MKRYIIIGVAGVVVILIALILNFWLTPGEDGGPGDTPPVALAPPPEPTPAPMPAPEMPAAPVAEPDTPAPGGPVATPDSAAERPPETQRAAPEPAPTPAMAPTSPPRPAPPQTPAPPAATPSATAPGPTAPAAAPAPTVVAPAPPPIPEPRGIVTAPRPQPSPDPAPLPTETAPSPTEAVRAPVPVQPTPAPAPAPTPPETAAAPPPAASPAAEPRVALLPPPEIEQPAVVRPSFDVVRVTPNGETVIAGRAAPGAVVTVYDGGRPIGEVRADSRGEWVLVPEHPLPPGSRELTASARVGSGAPVWSDSVVVVVVPETGRDVAGRAAEQPSEPLVVEVPRTGFGASNVLQQPRADDSGGGAGGEAGFDLAVTVLDYDSAGNLSLTGRARAGSDIRVYLDNGLLGRAPSDADGNWRLTVKREITPGLYTMRVDEVASDSVVARLEFPFSRADPREIETGTRLVVVQPGNSLWRLARRTLGEGVRYTVIYAANRDRIRDPDLIYPGQILEVPQTN